MRAIPVGISKVNPALTRLWARGSRSRLNFNPAERSAQPSSISGLDDVTKPSLVAINDIFSVSAALLRADPAEEWIATQPVTRREIRLARSLVAISVVAGLAASSLIPAALFAPHDWNLGDRALFVGAGLGLAVTLAAGLLATLSVLGGRAETALVLVQTSLFAGVVIGALVGLRSIPEIAGLAGPRDGPAWLALLPSTWFAQAVIGEFVAPLAATATAIALLFIVPAAPAPGPLRRGAVDFV